MPGFKRRRRVRNERPDSCLDGDRFDQRRNRRARSQRPSIVARRARGAKRRLARFERLELRAMLAADVIINELMYHPSSGDIGEEYIELFNRASGPAATDTANLT